MGALRELPLTQQSQYQGRQWAHQEPPSEGGGGDQSTEGHGRFTRSFYTEVGSVHGLRLGSYAPTRRSSESDHTDEGSVRGFFVRFLGWKLFKLWTSCRLREAAMLRNVVG
jgi:hypothetical protein